MSARRFSARRSIRPTSCEDWGRSDDDQRHRLVIDGTINTPMAPATTAWERLSHGFQVERHAAVLLGAAVQHHVGRRQPAGHDGPSARQRDGRFAQFRRAQRRPSFRATPESGGDYFTLNLRLSRDVPYRQRDQARRTCRSVQRHQSREQRDAKHDTSEAGAYPTIPLPAFNQITAVGDPRTLQFGVRFTF